SAPKIQVVDSDDAGNAFTVAVAVRQLLGIDLASIHDRAEQAARHVCTQPGATPALPRQFRFNEGCG
ncbi:MAG: hypothetical protein KAU28_05240, partial [Phycisphaerae bacterium]|nr:hypothetical protein [Phycisphaerae bacterium]